MRSTLVFNIYDIVWWYLCHLESSQPYCAMALWVFITQTVNVQISVWLFLMRSTLVFNAYDIVWWCLCHLELTQPYCAMASQVFIIQTVNFQISVLIVPGEIYPCFQCIWHCLMILMSPRVDPALLCHGPTSFHYPDCKCSNQCFDWELTARTQKTSRTKSGYIPMVSWCFTSMSKNLEISVEPNVVHIRHATIKRCHLWTPPCTM